LFGIGFLFTLGASALLAVAVSGTINTFVNGSVMEASQLNTNFSSLKTAIEGITSSQWTSNGSNIYYNAGNVGIGTTSPTTDLEIKDSSGHAALFLNASNASTNMSSYIHFFNKDRNWQIGNNNTPAGQFFIYDGTAGANRLVIDTTGNVGIGTTSPASLLSINSSGAGGTQVYVKGQGTTSGTFSIFATDSTATTVFYTRDDGVGYLKAASWTYGSDKKMKKNIRYLDNDLDKILKLRPAKFDYIQGSKNQIGFIAQDVQEVIPEAVEPINDGNGSDLLGLKSEFIVPYLVNAVKELKSLHDKETSDLSLRLRSVTESLRTATEELASLKVQGRASQQENDSLKKELAELRKEIASARAHSSMPQRDLQQVTSSQIESLERRLSAMERMARK
ncbi:MAG TPA: tail fiber domain-containing protein, partial [Leptospiraceae bacterium]|nr:tail fiber domain-containing protein [Leptospiraceae bacterium]